MLTLQQVNSGLGMRMHTKQTQEFPKQQDGNFTLHQTIKKLSTQDLTSNGGVLLYVQLLPHNDQTGQATLCHILCGLHELGN